MERIDKNRLPEHIAIIMDGNGRWAKENALRRVPGHKKGASAVRTTVRTCRELGIRYLTLYAFSVENWNRPNDEIGALMLLLNEYLRSELKEMVENDIKLTTIGNTAMLPEGIKSRLLNTMEKTNQCGGMVLNLALSYGGRDEIVAALRNIVRDVQMDKLNERDISKDTVSKYLYTKDIPDPDLLIRTSGEYRLSNFLLWQAAYTELYFTPVLWPDFSRENLIDAIVDYQKRERRYGKTSEQISEN